MIHIDEEVVKNCVEAYGYSWDTFVEKVGTNSATLLMVCKNTIVDETYLDKLFDKINESDKSNIKI